MKIAWLVTALLLSAAISIAQPMAVRDSFIHLNNIRIRTNKTGMEVLGGWGIANMAIGGTGFFTAKNNEKKAFYGMNAIWGIINTGIAGAGLAGIKREMNEKPACSDMLLRYEGFKRLYLINAGLDILYSGTGIYLLEQSKAGQGDIAQQKGFGKSLMVQGIFLFVFDNMMFSAHQLYNKQWYRLLQGVCVTGNSIGMNYCF